MNSEDFNKGTIFYVAYPFMDVSGRYCHVGCIERCLCNPNLNGHFGTIANFTIYLLDSFLKPYLYQISEKSMHRAEPQPLPNYISDKLFFEDI
jgi:hypothetical protein